MVKEEAAKGVFSFMNWAVTVRNWMPGRQATASRAEATRMRRR